MTQTSDVVVIGGGPAGLAAAIAARLRGFHVSVLEASEPPIQKACGEGLMPDSLAALRELGVEIQPGDGAVFTGIRFRNASAQVQAEFPNGTGIGVLRPVLHQKMIERAQSLDILIHWRTPVCGVEGNVVRTDKSVYSARWIVGADGLHSRVRRWAGLDSFITDRRRFGYRRHFQVRPWSPFVEIHWGERSQCYVTPVGPAQICLAMITRDQNLRYHHLPELFPDLAARLEGCPATDAVRGSMTSSRRVRSVYSAHVALIGDASGAVDAITGEGLCLAFRQATALAEAFVRGDLRIYAKAHREIARKPHFMASLMLLMDGRELLRRRAFAALTGDPNMFGKLLALHVEGASPLDLGWQFPLSFGYRFLTSKGAIS